MGERIVLNRRLYDKDAVTQAIQDFRKACRARIVNDDIEVELIPRTGEEPQMLCDEFCNYVLGLMRSK
jgi:hypothetical protein